MQSRVKISVIIPTYNRADMLVKAVNSALNQTYPVTEIIVCDDGSSDNSKQLIIGINDPKVIWIDCGKNGEPAIPRNKGIKQSKGDWIALLDSDDEWLPNKIEEQIKIAQLTEVNVVCANANRIVGKKNTGPYSTLKNNQALNFFSLVVTNNVICSTVLIKKETIEKYSCFPEDLEFKAPEDYALWLRVSCGNNIYYIAECLINYNDDSSSSIRKDSLSTQDQLKIIFRNFYKWYRSNTGLCENYMVSIMEEVFVLRFLSKSRRLIYKLFKKF